MMTADERFAAQAEALGHSFSGEIKIGGNYTPVVVDGTTVWVSGQIPRVGDSILVTGAAGDGASLEQARHGARICAMRALALVQRACGSLDDVAAVLRMTVYVRSAAGFTQQSEVADAASDLLAAVLGPVGAHTRTSVGVAQLPKGATVEADFVFKVRTSSKHR